MMFEARTRSTIYHLNWPVGLLLIMLATGCTPTKPLQSGHSEQAVIRALYAQLNEWQGTPYRYGGSSRRGVDCSGFVQQTFQQRFAATVPRTTQALAGAGRKIQRKQLQAGDLVFFRTGIKSRHVGIYVAEGKFVHASESAGVTLSSLMSGYWGPRFWQARRLPLGQ